MLFVESELGETLKPSSNGPSSVPKPQLSSGPPMHIPLSATSKWNLVSAAYSLLRKKSSCLKQFSMIRMVSHCFSSYQIP